MNINKNNPYESIVQLAGEKFSGDNRTHIKNLSQSDRKLIAYSCAAFRDMQIEKEPLVKLLSSSYEQEAMKKQKKDLDKLQKKLESLQPVVGEYKHSNFLIRFFKFLGNKLGLRITTDKLSDEIYNAYRDWIRKHKRDQESLCESLKDILDCSHFARLGTKNYDTIDAFISLVKVRDKLKEQIKKDPANAKASIEFLTGFTLDSFISAHHLKQIIGIIDEAPELLVETYGKTNKARENGQDLNFFRDAFSEDDKDKGRPVLNRCYQQIVNFSRRIN